MHINFVAQTTGLRAVVACGIGSAVLLNWNHRAAARFTPSDAHTIILRVRVEPRVLRVLTKKGQYRRGPANDEGFTPFPRTHCILE